MIVAGGEALEAYTSTLAKDAPEINAITDMEYLSGGKRKLRVPLERNRFPQTTRNTSFESINSNSVQESAKSNSSGESTR